MHNTDIKIFELYDYLRYKKVVGTQKEFCFKIEMKASTLTKIKKGEAHFTVQHIEKACKVFGANANWVFDIEPNMFLNPKYIEN